MGRGPGQALLRRLLFRSSDPGRSLAWSNLRSRLRNSGPPLGPPSAHLGESIIAWAIEVRWDIPMGSDHFMAVASPIGTMASRPTPPCLPTPAPSKSGFCARGESTISVSSALPAPVGSEIAVSVAWPSAPSGQGAGIELHRRTNASNGIEGVVASVNVDSAQLDNGTAEAQLLVPPGSAPSFDGAGLEIRLRHPRPGRPRVPGRCGN